MLIRKRDKGLMATPLKVLRYLGFATVIIIMLYHGIRVFDQIKEDQDMEILNIGFNSHSDRKMEDDQIPGIDVIELLHTDTLSAMSFTAFQRRFDLKLTPMKHHLISEKAHILKSSALEIDHYFNETNTFKKCEFYHGAGEEMSAAISYCKHRGFWGRITTKEGVYDIERIDGDRHQIISVDLEDEMEEWRTNDGQRDSISFHQSDADEPNIARRRQTGQHPQEMTVDGCATIEMLLIHSISIQSEYASKYPNDPEKLNEDSLAMLLEAHVSYKNTVWIKNGVEFICFDVVLSAILKASTDPDDCWDDIYTGDPRCWVDDSNQAEHFTYFNEVSNYVRSNHENSEFIYDATYGIRIQPVGYNVGGLGTGPDTGTGQSYICHSMGTASVGKMGARTFAHELGHNLGVRHDQDPKCTEYGGDFGHIMGYSGGVDSFSHCSVSQVYDCWQNGDYECLWTTETAEGVIRTLNGHCGNGKVEGLEECDDVSNHCCDMSTCTLRANCCIQQNEVFECVEVRNEGTDFTIYSKTNDAGNYFVDTVPSGYVNYYGVCINPTANQPAIYQEMEIRHGDRSPFVLQHVIEVPCCGYADKWKSRNGIWKQSDNVPNDVDGDGFWILSIEVGGWKTDVICLADPNPSDSTAPAILPKTCDWRYLPSEWSDSGIRVDTFRRLSTLITRKVTDTSLCSPHMTSAKLLACYECLDWDQIPQSISIKGAPVHASSVYDALNDVTANRNVDINGVYERINNEQCDYGMPFFVKDFLQIVYNSGEDQWFVSYWYHRTGHKDEHVDIARCVSTKTVFDQYQDLFSCTAGSWHYSEPHSDYVSFDLKPGMKIVQQGTSFASMNHWAELECSERQTTESPSTGRSESASTVHEQTTFLLMLHRRRRLGGGSTECVAFMNVLFPGWPANSADIPNDVAVECIAVTIATDQAILKWDMISVNQAAMKQIENAVAERVKVGIQSTISESGLTVDVTAQSTTGRWHSASYLPKSPESERLTYAPTVRVDDSTATNEIEAKSSEKEAKNDYWVVIVVILAVIIVTVGAVVVYRRRAKATKASGKNPRVWVDKSKVQGRKGAKAKQKTGKGENQKYEERKRFLKGIKKQKAQGSRGTKAKQKKGKKDEESKRFRRGIRKVRKQNPTKSDKKKIKEEKRQRRDDFQKKMAKAKRSKAKKDERGPSSRIKRKRMRAK